MTKKEFGSPRSCFVCLLQGPKNGERREKVGRRNVFYVVVHVVLAPEKKTVQNCCPSGEVG